MKVLVPVKRVVDHNVKVRAKSDGTGVDLNNVKMSINPFDEIAVEEAVRLKEAGKADEVIAVSIGAAACQDVLRNALALGADRAILVQTEIGQEGSGLEPLAVAKVLSKIVQQESPDLVVMGKQAIDDDCNQTGQMLSALLAWPQGTFISELNIADNGIEVQREVDAGIETLALQLPAVVTCDLRLNEPRYASLPNIMKAKRKPLDVIEADSLGLDLKPRLSLSQFAAPAQRSAGEKVSSVAELVEKLKTQAKVI